MKRSSHLFSHPALSISHHGRDAVAALQQDPGGRPPPADLHLPRGRQRPEASGAHARLLPDAGGSQWRPQAVLFFFSVCLTYQEEQEEEEATYTHQYTQIYIFKILAEGGTGSGRENIKGGGGLERVT